MNLYIIFDYWLWFQTNHGKPLLNQPNPETKYRKHIIKPSLEICSLNDVPKSVFILYLLFYAECEHRIIQTANGHTFFIHANNQFQVPKFIYQDFCFLPAQVPSQVPW